MNIRKFVKNNIVFSRIFYAVRHLTYSRNLLKYSHEEVRNDLILFNNFNGRGYGDNPKAIADEFHRLFPHMKLVWACAKQNDSDTLPDYIEQVKFQSKEYFHIMAVSKVWIFNVLPPGGTHKRSTQVYVQTWHGDRPLKKILYDAAKDSVKYRRTTDLSYSEKRLCDYFVSGSSWFSAVWRRTSGFEGEILEYGMPRNDCLVHWNTEENRLRAKRFKERHSIPQEVKVLLYAPTFRDHSLNDQAIETHPDLLKIVEYLKGKDSCEWVCIVRAHSGSRFYAGSQSFIDVTSWPDMSDVLLASDFLITDYSSCAGDFALMQRPVILYQEDFEDYTEKDRKLYFRMEETPYFTAHNMTELFNRIDSLDEKTAVQNCKDILSFYQVKETGNAAEAVCRKIMESIEQIQVRNLQ